MFGKEEPIKKTKNKKDLVCNIQSGLSFFRCWLSKLVAVHCCLQSGDTLHVLMKIEVWMVLLRIPNKQQYLPHHFCCLLFMLIELIASAQWMLHLGIGIFLPAMIRTWWGPVLTTVSLMYFLYCIRIGPNLLPVLTPSSL